MTVLTTPPDWSPVPEFMEINEVQSDYYTQDLGLGTLRALVDIGVLVHVQTTVADHFIQRYFVPTADAHPFKVNDLRSRAIRRSDLGAEAEQVVARTMDDENYARITSNG